MCMCVGWQEGHVLVLPGVLCMKVALCSCYLAAAVDIVWFVGILAFLCVYL